MDRELGDAESRVAAFLSKSALLLFPFLRMEKEIILPGKYSASLWFRGLAAEPLYSTRVSLGSGIRSACLAASLNSPDAMP